MAKTELRGAKPVTFAERAALEHLIDVLGMPAKRGLALDIGAHVGVWSQFMAQRFDKVIAFEPSPAFDDLAFNMAAHENVTVHNAAVMARVGRVRSFHHNPKKRVTFTSWYVEPVASGGVKCLVLIPFAYVIDSFGKSRLLVGVRQGGSRCRTSTM